MPVTGNSLAVKLSRMKKFYLRWCVNFRKSWAWKLILIKHNRGVDAIMFILMRGFDCIFIYAAHGKANRRVWKDNNWRGRVMRFRCNPYYRRQFHCLNGYGKLCRCWQAGM